MDHADSPSCGSCCGQWWQLPLMLALALVAVVLVRHGAIQSSAVFSPSAKEVEPQSPSGENPGQVVSLAIDFGDGRREVFEPIAWRAGMTVLDVLREAARQDLRLSMRGTGSAAFLTEINGVENEGAAGRNWTYSVNGQYANCSFAVYELRPGDDVLWTFAPHR